MKQDSGILYRSFGRPSRRVLAVGLGAGALSAPERPRTRAAIRVVHVALEAGVTLIDTAESYSPGYRDVGHNELLVARALREYGRRARDVVVSTKGGILRLRGGWTPDGHPEALRASCEASLRRLGVDAIPLYFLHVPDPRVPWEDSLGELSRLRREGKILNVGLSNVTPAQLRAALKVGPVAAVQNVLNPLNVRDLDNGLVRFCEARGLLYLAHSPLGGHAARKALKHAAVAKLAHAYGLSPARIVLAWLLGKSESILALAGATKVRSASDSARAATGFRLEGEDSRVLDRIAGS